jgi:phosphatidylglycerol lysyltransferase
MCDRYAAWTVFYQVGPKSLYLYLDLRLTPLKIGEEARVPLDTFPLEGGAYKSLRQWYRRMEKEGYTSFEVIPSSGVALLLPAFKRISDA